MKKFLVHYNYYATVDVTVLANSKEEAIEKADQIEFDNNDFELDFESREVFESEDATSIQRQISCNNQNDKKSRVNINIYSI